MSITKEIDRLAQAKAAMSLALTEKGVTVSSEDKIDKYASLIKKIPVGTNTSDATANIDEIFAGKTAYVSTGKVTGTFSIDKEIDEQNLDINAIIEALKDKAAGTGEVEEKTINIVKNGTETVEPSLGKSLSKVVINVDTPIPKDEQEKNITIDKNGSYPITPDQGKVLSKVIATVNIPSDKKPETAGSEIIKVNGKTTFNPPAGSVFSSFTTDVQVPSGDSLPNGTKWEDSNITIGNYYSLAEIAGVCVAANYKYGPGLVWSDDGKFWHESDTHGVFHEVVSANGVCVAVSIDTGLFYTYDGKHWMHSNVTTGSFRTVAEYCGRFVAAYKEDGGMWWSDDGETWLRTNVVADGFRVVTATNGRWIASGNTTGLWWSDDGKTWAQSNISTGQFYCVAAAGSLFLAGSNGKGVYWSEDGKTWHQSTLTAGGARWICVHEGLAMAAMWGQGLWWSEDGKTWNQSNVKDNQWMYISGDAGVILASGWHPGMWWSTDGKTWKPSNITSGNFHPTKIFKGVWVLGCGQIGLKYSPVWSEYARPLQEPQEKALDITKNGDYTFEADPGKTLVKATAKVRCPAPKPEQEKEITISENGDYPITADVGKVLSKVLAHVNVPTGGGGGDIETTTGTYVPAKDIGYQEYVEIDTGNTKGKTVFVMWAPEYPGKNAVNFVACVYEENSEKKGTYGYADTSGNGRFALLSAPYAAGGKVKFAVRWSGAEVFKAGTNFKWVCVAGIPYN